MKLMKILSLIKEQSNLSFNQETPGNIIEFPNQNFIVTLIPEEKRLIFIPQFHNSLTRNMDVYISQLHERFRITQINDLDKNDKSSNAFEILIDPREDWSEVDSFVRAMANKELR